MIESNRGALPSIESQIREYADAELSAQNPAAFKPCGESQGSKPHKESNEDFFSNREVAFAEPRSQNKHRQTGNRDHRSDCVTVEGVNQIPQHGKQRIRNCSQDD